MSDIQTVQNIKNEEGLLSFDLNSLNSSNHYAIDIHRVSGAIVKHNCLILAIEGAPKQIIYCSQQDAQAILKEITVHTDDNIVAIKGYGDYELYAKASSVSMAIAKQTDTAEGLFICLDAYDQHSKTGSFSQFIPMSKHDALHVIKLL